MAEKIMRRILTAGALAVIFIICAGGAADAGEPIWKDISEEQLVKLFEGGRVAFVDRRLFPGKEMAVGGVIIDEPAEKVWNALVDFEKYPDLIDQITRVRVYESGEDYAIVHFYMFVIKLGPVGIKSNYIQKWKYEKPGRIVITPIEKKGSKFKEVTGDVTPILWDIVPVEEGKRTILIHSTISDLREAGAAGKYMVDVQPTIQIGFDLATSLTQTQAIKKIFEKE
ncbi:MAG TPA: SRPBCC family protein [bacterium]|nr:SRPBCC family protein [bacterium]